MNAGPELFYESWEEALKDDIKALGGTKTVGKMLWPDLETEIARNRLNDRLNPDRRERLSDSQERMIMRSAREKRGFSAAMCFLADETGFERPKSRDPAAERDRLAEVVASSTKTLAAAVEALQRIGQQA